MPPIIRIILVIYFFLFSSQVYANARIADLSGTIVPGGNVREYKLSPDGDFVVFIADKEVIGQKEIYSARIDGKGGLKKINTTLPSGGDVLTFEISPDSRKVIYLADSSVDGIVELYGAPIFDGEPTKLNNDLLAGRKIEKSLISSDSDNVVYLADQDLDNVFELYSAPILGGDNIRLNENMVQGGDVTDFSISPNGSTVVFRADKNEDEVYELFSTPISGGEEKNLVTSIADEVRYIGPGAPISIGSSEVVIFSAVPIDLNQRKLYRVPISGGEAADLSSPSINGSVLDYKVCRDTTLVFRAATQLYSIQTLGGDVTNLTAELALESNIFPSIVSEFSYQINEDCTHVIFKTPSRNSPPALFSVAITGGELKKLNPTILPTGDISSVKIVNDRVVFDLATNGAPFKPRYLYSSSFDGEDITLLARGNPVFGFLKVAKNINSIFFIASEPDGERVIKLINLDNDSLVEYPLMLKGPIGNYDVSRDSKFIVIQFLDSVELPSDAASAALISFNLSGLLDGDNFCFPIQVNNTDKKFALTCL